MSQLQLALAANCSQRHLSFLELGRTRPSREMVVRLAGTLGLSLRQSNALLLAAGFAPVWSESDLAAAPLAAVRSALDHLLAQQEPYPAVVVDRCWNLLQLNRGAGALITFLVGAPQPGARVNLADALISADVLRPFIVNWTEVVRYFLRGIEADGSEETAHLLERLLTYPDVRALLSQDEPEGWSGPVVPMHFRKDGIELSLFTTIATLGTPRDVTLQEIKVESFFPMDDATRTVFARWSE